MHVKAIKTHKININDSLSNILDSYVKGLCNKDILIVTSKIISILQGSLISKNSISKRLLITQEADLMLETQSSNTHELYLTIKEGILIPSAGIDESNVDGYYVLYPRNIQESAAWIWKYLKAQYNLEEIGVVITDSHTTMMRRGVTGIALGWCGFEPLYSYVNKSDLYNNLLKVTQVNILDSLASSAVFVMGEGNEQTPLAIIKEAPKISFLNRIPNLKEEKEVIISMDEDIYGPILRSVHWIKNAKRK